ncbi:MAG: DUF3870 domain-containing protein [Clostridiales bacterium]|nr:DUF3870 domain-containing protein [Clostridiales bacterium]
MAQYSNNTLCFISFTKLPSDTPLYELHKVISFGFVVDYETGIIEDIITTMIVNETKEFIKHLLIGHNLNDESVDDLTEIIKYRYHASAQRALCLAFRQSCKKYFDWRKEHGLPLAKSQVLFDHHYK